MSSLRVRYVQPSVAPCMRSCSGHNTTWCVHFMTYTKCNACRLCSLCGAMLWATVHSGQGSAGRCCCSSSRRWCHHCQRGSHPASAEEEQHASPHCSLMGTGELCIHVLMILIQAAAHVKQDSSLSSGCATDMVAHQGKHLRTVFVGTKQETGP